MQLFHTDDESNQIVAYQFPFTQTSGPLEAKLYARQLSLKKPEWYDTWFGEEVQKDALKNNIQLLIAMVDDRTHSAPIVASVAQKRAYAKRHNFGFDFHSSGAYHVRGDECLSFTEYVKLAHQLIQSNVTDWFILQDYTDKEDHRGRFARFLLRPQSSSSSSPPSPPPPPSFAATHGDSLTIPTLSGNVNTIYEFYFHFTWLYIVHRQVPPLKNNNNENNENNNNTTNTTNNDNLIAALRFPASHQPWCIFEQTMAKLGVASEVLSRAPRNAYMWLADADVLLKRPEMSLRGFAEQLRRQRKSIAVTEWNCGDGTNVGSFILRNDEWGRAFIRRWMDLRHIFHMFFVGDQGLFWTLESYDPSFALRGAWVPPRTINARLWQPRGCARFDAQRVDEVYSHAGDFNVHLSSLGGFDGWNAQLAEAEWCDFIEFSGAECTCESFESDVNNSHCDVSSYGMNEPFFLSNFDSSSEYDYLSNANQHNYNNNKKDENEVKNTLPIANDIRKLSFVFIGTNQAKINDFKVQFRSQLQENQFKSLQNIDFIDFFNSSNQFELPDGLPLDISQYRLIHYDCNQEGFDLQLENQKFEGGAVFPARGGWTTVAAARASLHYIHQSYTRSSADEEENDSRERKKKSKSNDFLSDEDRQLHWLYVVHLQHIASPSGALRRLRTFVGKLRAPRSEGQSTVVHALFDAKSNQVSNRTMDAPLPWLLRASEYSRQLLTRISDGYLTRAFRSKVKIDNSKETEDPHTPLLQSEQINATQTFALFRRRDVIVRMHTMGVSLD